MLIECYIIYLLHQYMLTCIEVPTWNINDAYALMIDDVKAKMYFNTISSFTYDLLFMLYVYIFVFFI